MLGQVDWGVGEELGRGAAGVAGSNAVGVTDDVPSWPVVSTRGKSSAVLWFTFRVILQDIPEGKDRVRGG